MTVMQIMNDKLRTWLDSELKNRGWSDRELGRRSGLTGAAISAVKTGVRKPGWDLCAAIAEALGKPPLEVFRLAGLLPEESKGIDESGLLHRYRQLTPDQQQTVIAMLSGLLGQQAPQPVVIRAASNDHQPVDPVTLIRLIVALNRHSLHLAYNFLRWLVSEQEPQPEQEPLSPNQQALLDEFLAMPTAQRELVAGNLRRWLEAEKSGTGGNTDSGPGRPSGQNHPRLDQGKLF